MLILAVSCGGSGGGGAATTKAQWQSRHGAAIAALSTQLDYARTALDNGQRDVILSACNLLHDDLTQARSAVPVPNSTVNAALQSALDAVSVADNDCIQGARIASSAALNEKAMAELTNARSQMDLANRAIANWT
jgi:hypothetical protein